MKEFIDELTEIAIACEEAARPRNEEPLRSSFERLQIAIEDIGRSFSGSCIGYHAWVYYRGLQPPPPGDYFDVKFGLGEFSDATPMWQEVPYDIVHSAVLRRAGDPDVKTLESLATACSKVFETKRANLLTTISVLLEQRETRTLQELRDEARAIEIRSTSEIADEMLPSSFHTNDHTAASQGLRAPHHVVDCAWLLCQNMKFTASEETAAVARKTVDYLTKQMTLGKTVSKAPPPGGDCVFIGHGHSSAWRELKDFLQDRLNLAWEEYDRESSAGKSRTERLAEMLKKSQFAFLVLTAEDQYVDSKLHARENVIHEVGLFQGRLGFERAIVLLEVGCEEFSNIVGLGQIRFEKGHLSSKLEEIRKVLERERLIEPR